MEAMEPVAALEGATSSIFFIFVVMLGKFFLLNLLIAVMGATYTERAQNAMLEWRWEMARLVLRMELITPYKYFRSGDLHCGERDATTGEYFYIFRQVAASTPKP